MLSGRTSKGLEDAFRRVKVEHDTYEFIYADLIGRLEREGLLKKVKAEVSEVIGYGDIINEEKTDKIESRPGLM